MRSPVPGQPLFQLIGHYLKNWPCHVSGAAEAGVYYDTISAVGTWRQILSWNSEEFVADLDIFDTQVVIFRVLTRVLEKGRAGKSSGFATTVIQIQPPPVSSLIIVVRFETLLDTHLPRQRQ